MKPKFVCVMVLKLYCSEKKMNVSNKKYVQLLISLSVQGTEKDPYFLRNKESAFIETAEFSTVLITTFYSMPYDL